MSNNNNNNEWELDGNSGTNPAQDFLGTTDNQPLVIRTNNVERVRVDVGGNVGIGTPAPPQRLTLGSGNVQLPTAQLGDSGNLYLGGRTDAGETGLRLFGGLVNNQLPGGFIDVRTTGATEGLRFRVDTANGGTERMRITAAGNVGIGTNNPTQALDVNGGVISIHHGNRGRIGQTVNFDPDNNNSGLWIEGSDVPGGESAGVFLNGNTMVVWSPGDNDILKVFDEDNFAGGPVLRIAGNGAIIHRTTQIHADYVFEPEYELESIEEHAVAMAREKRLSGIPKLQKDETGHMAVDYGCLMRGLLEELEKAHIYIARISDAMKEQQKRLAELSARIEALPT